MINLIKLISEIEKIEKKDINKLFQEIQKSTCIFLLGNGGSSSICSHIAEDYTKTLKKRALTFSDSSQLTCYANDYGYDKAYVNWLSDYIGLATFPLVILISSSGNSKNILNCAEYCKTNKINYVLLTGFDIKNKLKELYGDYSIINIWVDSNDYGIVESVHQIFLHSVI